MNPIDTDGLLQTPLTVWHRTRGGRMVPFAGYEMPVQYAGVSAEHAAVRERVGFFDITHMGEIHVRGADAEGWLDGLTTNRVAGLAPGKVVYTAMCAPDGGVLDDMLIYRLHEHRWLVVCNAVNRARIVDWLEDRGRGVADLELEDASDRTAMIAVQGPVSGTLMGRLEALAGERERTSALEFYGAYVLPRPGGDWLVSRTGYTGERGYELYVPWDDALPLWEELLERGSDLGAAPIGLAARDTLRFEMGYSLYGHELSRDWTPLEAGIGWAVRLKNREFVGAAALRALKRDGVPRRIAGLEIHGAAVDGRARPAPIARQETPVYNAQRRVGFVTSGTKSPSLNRSLALALLDTDRGEAELEVEIRGKRYPATAASVPFLAPRVKGDPGAERS
ncbi:glycine cleavage system aminomethyltransferase GcvT [bacterium]|nr:glycine cleavage system aminomethyltransferase GcvT [bacterium]